MCRDFPILPDNQSLPPFFDNDTQIRVRHSENGASVQSALAAYFTQCAKYFWTYGVEPVLTFVK